jgi:hypothetical protein
MTLAHWCGRFSSTLTPKGCGRVVSKPPFSPPKLHRTDHRHQTRGACPFLFIMQLPAGTPYPFPTGPEQSLVAFLSFLSCLIGTSRNVESERRLPF